MSSGRAFCIVLSAILSLVPLFPQSAECITVKPAAFDHVQATVPDKVMAGEQFEVFISFFDRYGNLMPEGWKPASSLTLSVSQPATVLPPVLTPENYASGFRFRVSTERIGKLELSLRDSKARKLETWTLTISSGRPAKILVELQDGAEAGEAVLVSFKAVDTHGNVALGYEPEEGAISIEGSAAQASGRLVKSGKGVFEIPVVFREPGRQFVTIKDRRRGLSGISGPINVVSAPLSVFEASVGKKPCFAGEPIEITLRALDRFGNPVIDYARNYKGVRFTSKTADFTPALVPSASFTRGTATVRVKTRKSGKHHLEVSGIQSDVAGRLTVNVDPAEAKKISVKTPESAVAGEPFTIILLAEDEYGNRTNSFPDGSTVTLETSGKGVLKPGTVLNSSFKNGTAKVQALYEVAESFEIRAFIRGEGTAFKPSGDLNRVAAAKSSAQEAREEAVRSRRESRLKDTRVLEIQDEQPRVIEKSEKNIAPAPLQKGASAPGKEKITKPAPERPKIAETPVVQEAKKERVASRKPLRPGILDSVVVHESEKNGVVVFSTNGMTNYNVTTSAKLSRKWIDIEFPDIDPDLPGHLKGGGKIIGEIYVEKPENGKGVRISVEILPVRIGYEVYPEGDSLILKVTDQ